MILFSKGFGVYKGFLDASCESPSERFPCLFKHELSASEACCEWHNEVPATMKQKN